MEKVLHILPMNQLSGAEKMALLICKNLNDYEPIVVTGGEDLKQVFKGHNIKSYSLDFSKKKLFSTSVHLKQIIRNHQITILHAHDNTASLAAYITKNVYRVDVKIISHIHNCYPWLLYNGLNKKLDRWLRPRFDYNIACGKRVADYYLEHTDYFNKEKTLVLSNAMDLKDIQLNNQELRTQLRSQYEISDDCIILGFIGRLSKQKGIIPFIKEYANYYNLLSNCRVLLVGTGELENEIQQLIKDLKLEKKFILTGFQDDVYPFYQMIDIFILPSIYEGLPMVLLEAMAFEKPIVSMNVGSVNEVIIDYQTGFVIENNDLNLFMNRIKQLIENPTLKLTLAQNARVYVQEKYNIETYNKILNQTYQNIVQG